MATKEAASGVGPASDVGPAEASVIEGPWEKAPQQRQGGRASPRPTGITKAQVKGFSVPAGATEAFLHDGTVPGLSLRAYASGRKVWALKYRDEHGRTRRVGIGDAGALSPDEAREAARARLVQRAMGNDPAAAHKAKRHGQRVGELIETYLDRQRTHLKATTLDHVQRNLGKYAATLHPETVAALDRGAIYRLHNSLTKSAGAVQANRVLASLSAMFSWAMRAGLAESNPAALVPRNKEHARERVLGDDELAAVWRATEGGSDYARIVRLLMLTGCRREEIGGLRWSEVEGDKLVLPPARTKTAISHEVPLTELAQSQLPARQEGREFVFGKQDTGFQGWSRSKERLDAALGEREPWGLHDLRRTLSTRLNEAGVDPHVVEALLGHAGAKSGVAGVYNRAAYRQQKRDAMELWSEMVAADCVRERD